MSPAFKFGDIVWYQLPQDENRFVKARVLSVGTCGSAISYAIQRLDEPFIYPTYFAPQAHLTSVIDRSRKMDAANA